MLAEHLNRSRGAAAGPATISGFSGRAGQSTSQVSHALLADGHVAIGLEDPGSSRLWQAARTAGLQLVGLPVDEDGLVVDELEKYPGLRAVCVGAARQVATGCVLAPHRRSALLDWARRVDGLVVEDDFDSDSATAGPRRGHAGDGPAAGGAAGSVNRTLNPTVGIGWVVAPRRWVGAVRADREIRSARRR